MTVIEALEEVEDVRVDRCKKHKLADILMIYLPGFLCGLKEIKEIQNIIYWAKIREKD